MEDGILVLSFTTGRAFSVPLKNLLSVLKSNGVNTMSIVITEEKSFLGNGFRDSNIIRFSEYSILPLPLRNLLAQLLITYRMQGMTKNYNCCVFFMEGDAIIPTIFAKIMRKSILRVVPSQISRAISTNKRLSGRLVFSLETRIRGLSYSLANIVVLYSPILVTEWQLDLPKEKIRFASEHIVEIEQFRKMKSYNERPYAFGFIGRLSEEKGIFTLLNILNNYYASADKAIILYDSVIIGDGPLMAEVQTYIKDHGLLERVHLLGWVDHKDLPIIMNDIKIVLVTSLTEGLPNSMLEAMSCGCIVASMAVGAIPNVIHNGKNGFLFSNSNSQNIVMSLFTIMQRMDLDNISSEANATISKTYNLSTVSKQWRIIIDDAYGMMAKRD